MALANVTYTGDGTTINYTITFDYLDRTNIAVFVNGVDTTDVSSAYKFELTDDTHVDVTTLADAAVPAGAAIKIARITPTNSTATVFADGAVVRASALNANTNQLLYISQEVKDNDAFRMGVDNDDKFDALNKVIKNVANPTNPTDVTTKTYVEDTWLTLSDKAQLNSLNLSNLNTVATDVTNVNTTATNITNVNTVATNIADVNTLAGISGNVTAVVNNAANINAVVADAVDIGVVATNITDVNTVAGISANVTTAAGIASDITTVATYASNVTTVASDIAAVVTAANDLNEAVSEIDVVANNIADINTCGTNIAAIQDAPAQAAAAAASASSAASSLTTLQSTFQASAAAPSAPTEGDLWYDTVNSALKVYVSGSFQTAGAYLQGLTSTHVFTATAAQTTFTTDDASNTMSIFANGNTLVFLNGIRLVEGTSSTNDYYINGSSIELNSGAAAGDVLYVEVFTKVSTTQEASLNQLVTDAQTAEANASTSENNAAASAASASADATSTAADVVTTNADVVSTNADVVSSAASSAAASTSASNAATSEANAAASAVQAAASAGGGTLKITSNDTSSDVLINKLIAGTGITATTNNAGGNETLTLSVNPFSLTESNATATAAQTSFNVSYTVGLIQVFMNGVKLISGSDFTASNGTSITLASGAAAGDVLEFVVFG